MEKSPRFSPIDSRGKSRAYLFYRLHASKRRHPPRRPGGARRQLLPRSEARTVPPQIQGAQLGRSFFTDCMLRNADICPVDHGTDVCVVIRNSCRRDAILGVRVCHASLYEGGGSAKPRRRESRKCRLFPLVQSLPILTLPYMPNPHSAAAMSITPAAGNSCPNLPNTFIKMDCAAGT